jgi:hypothetical protein
VCVPVATVARKVSSRPTHRGGHTIALLRLPLIAIHVPAFSEQRTNPVRVQQPRRRDPRRAWSRTRARTGSPACVRTVMVYRHGASATGIVELVDMVALTGPVAVAAAVAAAASAAPSARKTSRIEPS